MEIIISTNGYYPSSREKEVRLKKENKIVIKSYDVYNNIFTKRQEISKV